MHISVNGPKKIFTSVGQILTSPPTLRTGSVLWLGPVSALWEWLPGPLLSSSFSVNWEVFPFPKTSLATSEEYMGENAFLQNRGGFSTSLLCGESRGSEFLLCLQKFQSLLVHTREILPIQLSQKLKNFYVFDSS